MNMDAFCCKHVGATHIKENMPLQDSTDICLTEDYTIVTTCDGHGSAKYFRSDKGSTFAVEALISILSEIYNKYPTFEKIQQAIKDNVIEDYKAKLLAKWYNKVREDVKVNPFENDIDLASKKMAKELISRKTFKTITDEMIEKQAIVEKENFYKNLEDGFYKPYGTTMLGGILTKEYYMIFQIGDGSLSLYDGENFVNLSEKFLTKADEPHSKTDSLCASNSYKKINYYCEQIDNSKTLGLISCSDGITEAYPSDEVMFKLFANIIKYAKSINLHGEELTKKMDEALLPVLEDISKNSGVKDDTSIAMAFINL